MCTKLAVKHQSSYNPIVFQLPGGMFVKPFPTNHRVPSQGYILYRTKKTLKAEFQGRTSQEITSLVRNNRDIFTIDTVPEVAYTGELFQLKYIQFVQFTVV